MPHAHSPRHPAPQRIAILYNPKVEGSAALAADICADVLRRPGVRAEHGTIENAEASVSVAEQDLLIVLGGDGSMLRTGRLAARYGVPLLSVNLGRLGFLGEVEPDDWADSVARVMRGDYWIEERMMLDVEHRREGAVLNTFCALNEAVVGRGALARPVRLKTYIDGGELTTYVADGLIVSTPTGSTAYALAAGGPVLPPEMKNILLIAIAPHLSLDRAIVLPPGVAVEVAVRTEHQAMLSADGHYETPLADGDRVHVRHSALVARFARVRPKNYFYSTLARRMQQNPSADKGR